MHRVISYDIVNDDRRLKVAKLLLNYGKRVQKSVFECNLDEKQYLYLKEKIDSLIDMDVDSVRFYSLCQRCVEGIAISGWGTVSQNEDLFIV
ncbi:MAG: CRISPR-associated endonuclease Cas2 [Candidatus Eremiobacteraeota bacterium]|jgi:CRISPR-associated protein Cas2|nr:CRISPR-associated endonuclease Cas2 [Candidatus Eremiobacteraeota bacterium]MCL5055054.1 CRISPR-associated endonuclease Cas2 [Bacillota bacterium]